MNEKYFFIKLQNGSMFIHRGRMQTGNYIPIKDLYGVQVAPRGNDLYTAFTRMDTALFYSDAEKDIYINPDCVEMSWEIKADSKIIEQLRETDQQANAAKSGIILPGKE